MVSTANVNIYHLREDADIDQLVTMLGEKYTQFDLGDTIKRGQNVEILAFQKSKNFPPDWYNLIYKYLPREKIFEGFKKYDLVTLIKTKSKNAQAHVFAFCGGSGQNDIEEYIEDNFGIMILENVFNPNINKIKAISEKGVTGNVLASLRYYRRPLPVAYENNFGKRYHRINTNFKDDQIKEKFPLFSENKGQKLKPLISVTGSSCVEIRSKVTFPELVLIIRDLSELAYLSPKPIFHTTLNPVDIRKQRSLVKKLDKAVMGKLTDFLISPIAYPLDFDFCPSEFEEFFHSSTCEIDFSKFNSTSGENLEPLVFDDVYNVSDYFNFAQLLKIVQVTAAYHKAVDKRTFLSDILQSVKVTAKDEEGNDTSPCGPLKNYLQLEMDLEGKSYFLLDKYWYVLEREFDNTLIENYSRKVTSNFKNLEFIKKWDTDNENNYNKAYDNPPYSFCFHQINVGHIEFCDVMFVDVPKATTYLIHVKDGIGATIRDLTSQVSIASHIIEGELLGGKSDSLEKLYDQGLQNNRINAQIVSKEDFVSWIKNFRREYILAVHCGNKSKQDIREGKFESRIAKFCLIEFASQMRSNDYNFSICCI